MERLDGLHPKNLCRDKICVSKNDGVSHACGHDAHTAMLLTEAKILNEHKENARKQAALQIAAEKERIARETNKNLSLGQIEIRRSYSRKDEELRGKVCSELRDRLARFMEPPKYDALLEAQIKKEKAFAGSSEIHIYIDPSDREKQNLLSLRTDCDIRVSQYPFLGGTRAVIASKNILIDNSFETKLKEAEQDFQFSL